MEPLRADQVADQESPTGYARQEKHEPEFRWQGCEAAQFRQKGAQDADSGQLHADHQYGCDEQRRNETAPRDHTQLLGEAGLACMLGRQSDQGKSDRERGHDQTGLYDCLTPAQLQEDQVESDYARAKGDKKMIDIDKETGSLFVQIEQQGIRGSLVSADPCPHDNHHDEVEPERGSCIERQEGAGGQHAAVEKDAGLGLRIA